MAIQTNFPAVKPALLLDFANTKRLDSRITFTRTTTATYYDGVTTAKAEENLVTYSQEFDNDGWVKTNLSVTANDTTAPDGTSTADKFTDDATNIAHRVVGTYLGLVGSTTYAFSAFLKKGTNNFAYIGFRDGATNNRYIAAAFNLDTGVAGDTFNPGSGTLVGSTITNIGNGWYRCSVIGSLSGTSVTTPQFIIGLSTAATGISLGGFLGEAYVGTGSTIYAWGAQLEQRSSVTAYTATTTQAITNYIPVLQTAVAGQARFDHNPVTRVSLGLLAEEARTNLLLQSSDFATTWAIPNAGATIATNTIVAPDGGINGDKLQENAGTGEHYIRQFLTGLTTNTTYTISVFVKASERTRFRIRALDTDNVSNGYLADFNLTAVTASGQNAGAGSVTGTPTITSVGNGWYRCVLSGNAGTGTKYIVDFFVADASGNINYAGVLGSGLFIWGAQLEAGAFATSYIPTVASSATRNADVANITDSNFTSWYNQGEGTVYVELTSRSPLTGTQSVALNKYPTPWRIEAGTTDTIILWYGIVAEFFIGGSAGYNNIGTVPTGVNKFALGFSSTAGQAASSLNGSTAVSRTGVLTGIAIRFEIGVELNGTISKIAYYRKRLTNSQLQNLTS
jgi:hypothetical protein